MALSLEDDWWSTSCSSSCWGTGDWSQRRSSCCSAAKGRERRFQEDDRECGLRERDLDLLRGQGVEDLEQEERPWWLGDIRLVRRPQGDRRADEEGERRLGDSDTSLVGLLVMPAGDGRREREGRVLDRRREAGERLRWWSVAEGKARWRWGPGLRLLTLGERERRRGLQLTVLSRLDGDERRSNDDERLWGRLRDRPSLLDRDRSSEGLLDLEPPSALFDRGDALSSEELGGRSASGPIIRIGTAGPIDDWGGATPKRSIIRSFMEESRASFVQSWMFGNVGDGTGRTWEGVAMTWASVVVAADTVAEGTGGPARRSGWIGKGRGMGGGGVGNGVFSRRSWSHQHRKRSRRSSHRIREGSRGSSVDWRHARNHQRRLERREDGGRATARDPEAGRNSCPEEVFPIQAPGLGLLEVVLGPRTWERALKVVTGAWPGLSWRRQLQFAERTMMRP